MLIKRPIKHCVSSVQRNQCKVVMQVLTKTRNCTFQVLNQHNKETHILDSELRDDHAPYIIKMIVKKYFILFYHQFGKIFIERILRTNVSSKRQKLTKAILFQKR